MRYFRTKQERYSARLTALITILLILLLLLLLLLHDQCAILFAIQFSFVLSPVSLRFFFTCTFCASLDPLSFWHLLLYFFSTAFLLNDNIEKGSRGFLFYIFCLFRFHFRCHPWPDSGFAQIKIQVFLFYDDERPALMARK